MVIRYIIVHATCCIHDPTPFPLCHHDLSMSSTSVRYSNVSTSHIDEMGWAGHRYFSVVSGNLGDLGL